MSSEKDILNENLEFLGRSLEDLRSFPRETQREAGFQLDRVQRGLEPSDSKPMPGIGSGVREIRIRDSTGAYRVVYIAKLADTIYVLHYFKKKTQRTRQSDIDLAQQRSRDLLQNNP